MRVTSKHGMSRTKLYGRWESIIQRTRNPKCSAYRFYGGRGINVCHEWGKFIPFMEWALSNGYSPDLEIDRINGDGDYCPQNCRWVDALTNKRNIPKRHRNKPYNWGVLKSTHGYFAQVWKDGRHQRTRIFKTEQEAIDARDMLESGIIEPHKRRQDVGIYEKPFGYITRVVRNKIMYPVGTFKTLEEARTARRRFIENMNL